MEMARIRSVLTEEQKAEVVAKRRAAAEVALTSAAASKANTTAVAAAAGEATSPPAEHKLSETAKSDSGSYDDAPLKGSEEAKAGDGETR